MTLKKHSPKWNWLGSTSRYYIIIGGRGSGKSFEVARYLTILSKKPKQKILFTRKTLTSAHASIIPEFTEKIDLLNLQSEFEVNKTEVTNIYSGSEILFKGLQSSSKDNTANLKSLQGVNVWVLDEAEELTNEPTFDKIDLSVREKSRENKVFIILNPTTKEHFIYKRFFEQAGVSEGFTGIKGDVTYIHSTYLDNIDNLSESFLLRAEEMRLNNPKKYAHIMLGGWLEKAEGVVFENWKFGAFNPDNLQTSCGMDFGYSIDPDTLTEVAIDKKKKIIYVKEHIYSKGNKTSDLTKMILARVGRKLIIADSAEPRLIDDLADGGVNIQAVKKGTIESGITRMQDFQIIVEENSHNIAKEFNNHVYADKTSKLYVDDWNHAIDGIRYNVTYHIDGAFGIEIW